MSSYRVRTSYAAAVAIILMMVTGALVFAQVCAACHGEEGKGGHGAGPDITKVNALELVANTVISGKNNMPPFAATLTFAQVRDDTARTIELLGQARAQGTLPRNVAR